MRELLQCLKMRRVTMQFDSIGCFAWIASVAIVRQSANASILETRLQVFPTDRLIGELNPLRISRSLIKLLMKPPKGQVFAKLPASSIQKNVCLVGKQRG